MFLRCLVASCVLQNKTEFSQDKYKRRKAKKYLTYLTVRQPTARVVCEVGRQAALLVVRPWWTPPWFCCWDMGRGAVCGVWLRPDSLHSQATGTSSAWRDRGFV